MNDSSCFFTDDSICDCDLREQYLVDDHLRKMSRVGDLDGDVREKQNNLFFFTSITSFFMDYLFFSSQT